MENEGSVEEINIKELVLLLWKKWYIIVASVVLITAAAFFYAYYTLDDEYTARASMMILVEDDNETATTDFNLSTRLVKTYSELAKSDLVIDQVIADLDLGCSPEHIRNSFNITGVDDTIIINLNVTQDTPEKAQNVANVTVSVMQSVSQTYEGLDNIEILDVASLPTTPSGPNRILYLVIGVILGGIVGVGGIFLFEMLDTTIKTSKDVETKLDLRDLASIPNYNIKGFADSYNQLEEYTPITLVEPSSVIAEQYRKLRTNIELSDFDKTPQVIGITSTNKMEGKTLTCLNLAEVYAQSKKKTLLIEMDLRRPTIHKGYGLSNLKGLSNLVTDNAELNTVIQAVNEYLDILPSGKSLPYPAEFLASEQLRTLIQELRQTYDRIIIDTPPMTAVTDASIISTFCDGMVIVIASRETDLHMTKKALSELRLNKANIIGAVLTHVDSQDMKYINYYRYV